MIPLVVFYVHVVAFTAVYTRRWQEEGVGEGVLAVFFMALVFFVGWSITSFLAKLALTQEGFGGMFDRDSLSLLLLTAIEAVFYYFFVRGETRNNSPTGSVPTA